MWALMCYVSHLVCVVRKVDFVEDLGRLVLDGLHFHQMRRIFPGSVTVAMTMMTKASEMKGQFMCVSEQMMSCSL